MTKAEMQTRLAKYWDTLRSMNTERWVSQYTDDAVVVDPVGTPAHRGPKELTDFFNGVRQNFQLLDLTPDFQIFTPLVAAVKFSARAVPNQGPEFVLEGVCIYRFQEDGKVTGMEAYWDLENPGGSPIKGK